MDAKLDDIRVELDRLKRPEWLPIVESLIENFRGYPFDHPDSQAPAPAIHAILKSISLSEIPKSTDDEFIRILSHNDMFSFRSVHNTPDGPVFWEPLKERFVDFRKSGAVNYQSAEEYPPPDMIRSWYYHRLRIIRQ
ncbi:MAG: hypothetical protein L3K25_07550 [Gammaproteobacteria bacterium]|nr:hypothetical protein [Gammaproteobacteria bacterium]